MSSNWQTIIDSLEINETPSDLIDNIIYPLTSQSLLKVAGPDAAIFLQGQLSCDVLKLSTELSGLGSHNTAKGRMRSSFRIARIEENCYLLRVHSSIEDQALNALKKYIVFSKAEAEALNDWAIIGLHGTKAEAAINNTFSQSPQREYQQVTEEDAVIICTSEKYKSYELFLPADKAAALWPKLSEGLATTSSQQHQLLQNQLGLAFVEAGTFEEFIPQMFNYQATPAISFTKGCYTGQEIVARMHYLGKLKRHMYHYTASTEQSLKPGETVFIANSDQGVGNIVSAVRTDTDQWDLLIVLTDEGATAETLSTEAGILDNLQRIDLPYSIDEHQTE